MVQEIPVRVRTMIAVLCARLKDTDEADRGELIRLMKDLYGSKKKRLPLSAGNLRCIKWYMDASFAVWYPDFKSHTHVAMSFVDGKGVVQYVSRNQKLNRKSSIKKLSWL